MEGHIRRVSFASSGKDLQSLVTLDLIVRAAKAAKHSRLAESRPVRHHRVMSSVSHYSATSASITLKSLSQHSAGVVTQAQRAEVAQAQAFYLHQCTDGTTCMLPLPDALSPRMQPPPRPMSGADARRETLPKLTTALEREAKDLAATTMARRPSEGSVYARTKQKREVILQWLRGVVRPRTDGQLPPMR